MAMYNQTVIIGRLGENPELKPHSKAEFQTEFYISNNTIIDGKEVTNWHKIAAFGKQAKLCSDYLHKGDLCCIEGKLDIDTRTEPFKQYIVAERITFLSASKKKETKEVCHEL